LRILVGRGLSGDLNTVKIRAVLATEVGVLQFSRTLQVP
jgi:hypothetical protein